MNLPRLLAGLDRPGALTLDAHVAVHGEMPADVSRSWRTGRTLVEEIRESGLKGRGGGGFPTARKLASVLAARGRPIVVVNGCEGEPASGKDRLLVERAPHLVIDGAVACARELEADRIVFAIDSDAPATRWALQAAIGERPDAGRRGLVTEIVEMPTGYLSGQETAIANFVNRGQAVPTVVPPMVFERGIARRPTFIGNAETVGQIGLIARHGAGWFRELGTDDQPGSALVTVGGGVFDPGVFEIEYGAVLGSLIDAAGGAIEPVRAVLFGGYGGAWVDGSHALELEISDRSLREVGATLGPGVIVALPQTACPVAETARVAAWLESQAAGQCGPCVNGLASIVGALGEIADGRAATDAGARLVELAGLVTGRGACAHPDGAARFVTSAVRVFATEFADHATYGRCPACSSTPILPVPARRLARAA
jgi:NADH:ubiquinone oxidoreductase subunit F (NADH-binding)